MTNIMAAILDPRFKLLWCKDDNERRRVKTILRNELAKLEAPALSVTDNIRQASGSGRASGSLNQEWSGPITKHEGQFQSGPAIP